MCRKGNGYNEMDPPLCRAAVISHHEVSGVCRPRSTGEQAAQVAHAQHRRLEVIKLPEATQGFVLLPKRWVVARSNAWAARYGWERTPF